MHCCSDGGIGKHTEKTMAELVAFRKIYCFEVTLQHNAFFCNSGRVYTASIISESSVK